MGGAVATFDRDARSSPVERDGNHAPHAFLARLFDAGRNFVGLAVAPADFAAAVADDDHRREAEATTTLDDRGAALDLDDVFAQLALHVVLWGPIDLLGRMTVWCLMTVWIPDDTIDPLVQ